MSAKGEITGEKHLEYTGAPHTRMDLSDREQSSRSGVHHHGENAWYRIRESVG